MTGGNVITGTVTGGTVMTGTVITGTVITGRVIGGTVISGMVIGSVIGGTEIGGSEIGGSEIGGSEIGGSEMPGSPVVGTVPVESGVVEPSPVVSVGLARRGRSGTRRVRSADVDGGRYTRLTRRRRRAVCRHGRSCARSVLAWHRREPAARLRRPTSWDLILRRRSKHRTGPRRARGARPRGCGRSGSE